MVTLLHIFSTNGYGTSTACAGKRAGSRFGNNNH
jgi:hypothetical protein